MCNAWNHPSWCRCGFGGEGYLGGGNHFGTSDLFSYRTSHRWQNGDNFCRPAKCPMCGGKCYFIRHNGGSVWIEKLGWPWPKHPCFENQFREDASLQLLLKLPPTDEMPVPGIILQASLDKTKTLVHLEVQCEAGETVSIEFKFGEVPNNLLAGTGADLIEDLAGSLVLVFRQSCQLNHPSLGQLQTTRMEFDAKAPPPKALLNWQHCPTCDYWIDVRQFSSHTTNCHTKHLVAPNEPQQTTVEPKPVVMPQPSADPQQDATLENEIRTRLPSNRLNWSDDELAEQEQRIVETVKEATSGVADHVQANKEAKRLAIETVNKLPRNLRKLLLPRFEKQKWLQVKRPDPS